MTTIRRRFAIPSLMIMAAVTMPAQTPLAKPLADFDRLVGELKTSSVVGEPIHAGDTSVIPFAAVKFRIGGGDAMIATGGGMNVQSVPLGVLIVEGDSVRLERFPAAEAKSNFIEEVLKALGERKLIIGNGINVGSFSGDAAALEPIMKDALGPSTIIGNGFNIGSVSRPASVATSPAQKK